MVCLILLTENSRYANPKTNSKSSSEDLKLLRMPFTSSMKQKTLRTFGPARKLVTNYGDPLYGSTCFKM